MEEDAGLSYCELVIIKAGWRKMQDYRTVNCYNKGRVEEDAGLSYCELVIIKTGVEEDAGLSYCELVIIKQ